MKVLVCSAARFGIANVVDNVLETFESADVEVTYCRNPLNPSPDWCRTVDLLDRGRYERLSETLEDSAAYRPAHLLYGILLSWRRAFDYIDRHSQDYDVVWLHSPHPVVFYVADEIDCPVVVTLHSEPKEHLNRDGLDSYYHRLLYHLRVSNLRRSEVRLVTGVGPDVTGELIEAGFPESQVEMVKNGVDIERFSPAKAGSLRERFDVPEEDDLLLSLGRFTEQKQPERIVELFAAIRDRREDVSLVMAGEGERRQQVQDLASERGIEDIHFPGFVSEAEKPLLYQCADYFLLASKYEGGYPPLTLSEAMASGLPCIVSDIQCAEIVSEADCGLVVDFEDGDVTGNVLAYLDADHPDHGANARRYAEDELSWASISERYLNLLGRTARG
jgi:glycosyltransferase involved in cell wall biosynthesis